MFAGGGISLARQDVSSQNVAVLQAAINADPNPSKGGGNITVVSDSALLPDSGPAGTVADIDTSIPTPKSDQISVYVVRPGDTLSGIAQMFGVSVNTIKWANDISASGVIHEGDILIILPVTGVQYTITKGDTAASIAKKFGGDAQEILNFNGIPDGTALAVGTQIIIPGGEEAAPAVAPSRSSSGSSGSSSPTHYAQNIHTLSPSYDGYYNFPLPSGDGILTQGIHGYNAVDLGTPIGTPVLAAASGQVIIARFAPGDPWFGGYGNYIVIQHDNGTQTLYAHLSKEIVERGWNVVQGQVLGYSGTTGDSTGPHLHFEVRGAKNPFGVYSVGHHF